MIAPRSVAAKVAAAVAAAAIVLGGIWVAGGLITNNFRVAMGLTVGWMALVAVAALVVARRWRALAIPVVGAYLLAAGAAGAYLGRSMFFDDVVDETVVTADAPARDGDWAAARNVLLARGSSEPLAHGATGVATAIRRADGGRVLTLTSFEVSNGPDLRVYLVAGPARDESEVDDVVDLGALKGNIGDQQYELPAGRDLDRPSTVVIWCRAFSVAFARAPLRRA